MKGIKKLEILKFEIKEIKKNSRYILNFEIIILKNLNS